MPADLSEHNPVEQQALKAVQYLSTEDQRKVLEYIASLINLETVKNDERSST